MMRYRDVKQSLYPFLESPKVKITIYKNFEWWNIPHRNWHNRTFSIKTLNVITLSIILIKNPPTYYFHLHIIVHITSI